MKIVLIILFVLMAILCFMGMIAENDLKLRKTFTIAFFALVFCITMLALKPFKIEFYILIMFNLFMWLNLLAIILDALTTRKQRKELEKYIEVTKERNEKLAEVNERIIERNEELCKRNQLFAEKNNKLMETLDAIINGVKEDGE